MLHFASTWVMYVHTFWICRAYRAFYILNWIYRYFTEQHFSRWIGESQRAMLPGVFISAWGYPDFCLYFVGFQLACLVSSKQLSMQISSIITSSGNEYNIFYKQSLLTILLLVCVKIVLFALAVGKTTLNCSCQLELWAKLFFPEKFDLVEQSYLLSIWLNLLD